MKNICGFSYLLLTAFIFFGVGTRRFALGDENCDVNKRSNRLVDQDFGMALTADDFLTSMISPWMFRDYFRPWRNLASLTRDWGSTIKSEKDKFQINLDVQHFRPDEITVKAAEGYIVVEGKHEEKEDEHGFVSRQFVRRYALPEGTDPESIVSQLSSDGVLVVTAPRKEMEHKEERVVPITQTGPVRKQSKEESEGSCEKQKTEL